MREERGEEGRRLISARWRQRAIDMLSYIRPRIPHFREYGLTFFDGYNHYSCIKNDAFSLSLSLASHVYIYFFLFFSLFPILFSLFLSLVRLSSCVRCYTRKSRSEPRHRIIPQLGISRLRVERGRRRWKRKGTRKAEKRVSEEEEETAKQMSGALPRGSRTGPG